jgi:predicted nucleic acid-binding protein
MVLDTNIIIDLLRGYPQAAIFLMSMGFIPIFISEPTHLEILQGYRDEAEKAKFLNLLNTSSILTLQFSEAIGEEACKLMEQHSLSSGLHTMDAIIAATVKIHDECLCTGNIKHFRNLGIKILPYSRR